MQLMAFLLLRHSCARCCIVPTWLRGDWSIAAACAPCPLSCGRPRGARAPCFHGSIADSIHVDRQASTFCHLSRDGCI
jgi:hypothetical protein